MTPLAIQAISILEAAIASPHGIVVEIEPIVDSDKRPVAAPALRAKQVLYRFRGELAPAFDDLQIRLSPTDPDRELWLVHRRAAESFFSEES